MNKSKEQSLDEMILQAKEAKGEYDDIKRDFENPIHVRQCCANCCHWQWSKSCRSYIVPDFVNDYPFTDGKLEINIPAEIAESIYCRAWKDEALVKLLNWGYKPEAIAYYRRHPILTIPWRGEKKFAKYLRMQVNDAIKALTPPPGKEIPTPSISKKEIETSNKYLSRLYELTLNNKMGLSLEAAQLLVATMISAPIWERGQTYYYDGAHGRFEIYIADRRRVIVELGIEPPKGSWVYTNGIHFLNENDPQFAAKYISAFNELSDPNIDANSQQLIGKSIHRGIFELTAQGWALAWQLTPTSLLYDPDK